MILQVAMPPFPGGHMTTLMLASAGPNFILTTSPPSYVPRNDTTCHDDTYSNICKLAILVQAAEEQVMRYIAN